jgi:DNA-binding transcriptional MerR regulator
VTRAPTDRSHLSIGEVLSLLQAEFPDVTISKIRFLEAQGLLDPERTPSGYRKFYDADVDRLRYILREQKDNYLPLKVIKDRLDETGPVRTAPTAAGSSGLDDGGYDAPGRVPATPTSDRQNGLTAVALDDRPAPAAERPPEPAAPPAAERPPPPPVAPATGRAPRRAAPERVAEVIEGPTPRPEPHRAGDDPTVKLTGPSAAPPPGATPDARSVSLTADELAQASGLSARAVRELEGYGLLETHVVGDTIYYDADALVIARTAAGFLEHGIEARHIRGYKVAAEREAALYEQIVLPLLKQRNPDAKRRAGQTVAELVRLGEQMRAVLLRRGLRDHIPPG